ncbi:MAG: Hydrogenase, membrane subunit 1-like protein (EchA-like) [Candidatus Moranbacteria bacterium GW2011_GWE1_35_17]|nr:MAG: Hydrogenase, membrane subunit 1-like protein (EchA-like) [Candidatus Moranbacteria bacterium GW2011_GWE1_35_17]
MNPIFITIPFLAAFLGSLFLKTESQVRKINLLFSFLNGGALIFYAVPFIFHARGKEISHWWLMDSFSMLFIFLVAFIYIATTIISTRYIGHEYEEKIINLRQYKLYFALFQMFVLCMILTLITNNSLVLWLALEGTTLFSTFLVGLYRKKTSIEAAWKYMILCSTGISLGLVGILLLSYGAHEAGVAGENIFSITALMESAHSISPNIIKLAFIFLFIGFGTKVGLAPMHNWLPDAHSKAPSPISAIFSAVLLNIALYAILRFKFITDSAFSDPTWTNNLFLIFGFLSVILSALMMLIQVNYKRMLAYSSIEHMGLILFSLGLSPLGAVAAVMHMIGHTFIKSTLFFGAGEILIQWKTTKVEKIKNMLTRARYTSVLFIVGILSIIAIPPSALFMSEYGMFSQAIVLYPVTAIIFFVALGIIAYAMLALSINMIFATEKNEKDAKNKAERWNITHTVMTIELIVVLGLAIWFTTSHGVSVIEDIVKDFLFIK